MVLSGKLRERERREREGGGLKEQREAGGNGKEGEEGEKRER